MKILLANLPWMIDGKQGVRAGSRWPHLKIAEEEGYLPYPFFLGYATALLKKSGFTAKGIDGIADMLSYNVFFQKASEFSPDLFFCEVSTPSLKQDLIILKRIKSSIGCRIAIAGPDMNIFDKKFMEDNSFIDFALIGEYEFTLLELAGALKNKKPLEKIKGLAINNNKKVTITPRRELEKNLEKYPWPDRDDFPIFKYHDCPGGIPHPSAQMISSRGCPYLCTFCVWPQLVYNGRNYRTRDVSDVVDEMEYLVKKGFKSIYFDDDTFNIGKPRMLKLAAELKKRNWKTPWAFMGRADLVDEEILVALKEVGLSAVKYGVESGAQELVDNAEKNLNLETARKNMLLTKRLGIKMHLTFTIGLPGETRETVKKTIDFAICVDPESVQFSIMTPFPGTRFYDKLKSDGMIMSDNYDNYDGNTKSVIRTKEMSSDDLSKAQRYAYWAWQKHKIEKMRERQRIERDKKWMVGRHPVELFFMCLYQHGLTYTIRHTINYLKKK